MGEGTVTVRFRPIEHEFQSRLQVDSEPASGLRYFPESQGQNLALTVIYVPHSLNIGAWAVAQARSFRESNSKYDEFR